MAFMVVFDFLDMLCYAMYVCSNFINIGVHIESRVMGRFGLVSASIRGVLLYQGVDQVPMDRSSSEVSICLISR